MDILNNNGYSNCEVSTNGNGHPNNDILFRVANVSDRDDILKFIRKHYYPEEPITIGNEPKRHSIEDENFSVSIIHYGATIIAIDPMCNNQIVGALIAGPIGPNEANDMIEEAKYCESKKWSEILQLLAYLEQHANIYERYNIDKALHIHVMGVDRQLRGKSIGIKLMNKCMEIGKKLNYPVVSVDCTSIYSIKIAEKLQMECIGKLAYTDYKDVNGIQLFRPPLPHTHIKTFAKIL